MKKNPKPILGYQLARGEPTSWERYHSLRVAMLTPNRWDRSGSSWDVLKFHFHWQAHERSQHSEGPSDWYAFKIHVDEGEGIEQLRETMKTVERVYALVGGVGGSCHSPAAFVRGLEAAGMKRVIYDPRNMRHVLTESVLPPEYHAWCMDYKRCGFTSNEGAIVMSRDFEGAQRELLRYFMSGSDCCGADHRLKVVLAWENAGRPMEQIVPWGSDKLPDYRTAAELVRSPKEAAAEAAARQEAAQPQVTAA